MDIVLLKHFERYKEIVDDWKTFIEFLQKPLLPGFWVNTLKISPSSLLPHMKNMGITVTPVNWGHGAYRISNPKVLSTSWLHVLGLCHIQDLISLVPVLLLNPKPGERILDLCAAPGNKTAFCGTLMKNKGLIVANDIDQIRLHTVNHMCCRLGIVNTVTTCHNGINYPYGAGTFDKVLVDVPCTCEGTFRKNPAILNYCSPEISKEMSNIQKKLLERAIKLCKKDGTIVYSTCTYAPEENEAVVDYILKKYDNSIQLLPVKIPNLNYSEGVTIWKDFRFLEDLKHSMRIWHYQNDTGGFFVAVLKKVEETKTKESPSFAMDGWKKEDPKQLLDYIQHTFGIDKNIFNDYVFYRKGRKKLNIVSSDHESWPKRPLVRSVGIPFMKTQINPPKLSTEAACLFGIHAQKNFVQVDKNSLEKYLKGEEFAISMNNIKTYHERGYVIVKYEDIPCGIGFLDKILFGKVIIKSMFPKSRIKANSVRYF